MLRRVNSVSDPSGRHANELDGASFIGVRHVQQRRWRPVVGFIQLKGDRGKMCFALIIRIQSNILLWFPLFVSATIALSPKLKSFL